MGFYIRSAFGLSILFLVLTLVMQPTLEEKADVQAAVLTTARETIRDLAELCTGEADPCAAAKGALVAMTGQARETIASALALVASDGPRPPAEVGAEKQSRVKAVEE